jgi:hypothetical protein
MKKLAGRDFEDLLQCAIPAFEGLLEGENNTHVMKLLYKTAEWHGFAKLRMHSESSLLHLKQLTWEFGQLMREFQKISATEFTTVELPREAEARQQQTMQLQNSTPHQSTSAAASTRKPRTLNLSTYKWHALGDYAHTVSLFGGTDSYSTQLVSLFSVLRIYLLMHVFPSQGEHQHQVVKRFYGLTSKRGTSKQIASRYMRMEAALLRSEPLYSILFIFLIFFYLL